MPIVQNRRNVPVSNKRVVSVKQSTTPVKRSITPVKRSITPVKRSITPVKRSVEPVSVSNQSDTTTVITNSNKRSTFSNEITNVHKFEYHYSFRRNTHIIYHTLNNLMGKDICTLEEYMKLQQEWFKLMMPEFENKYYPTNMFTNIELTNNIFEYILNKKGYNITCKCYHINVLKPSIPGHAIGAIFINNTHCYSVRKHGNDWFTHDSMIGKYTLYNHDDNYKGIVFHIFHV